MNVPYDNADTIHIVDVGTPAEYIFIGHAPMAVNVPLAVFQGTADPNTLRPDMPKNEHFIADVKKRFKETDAMRSRSYFFKITGSGL